MPKTVVDLPWLVRDHLPQVLQIEWECFTDPWTERDFLECLKHRNCIGMVAVNEAREMVGYMIYELLKGKIRLLNFAVRPTWQREGVGTQMIEKLITKLGQQRRQEIFTSVREGNLAAQLFFSTMGFLATEVVSGFYTNTDEDAFVFHYYYE